MGVVLEARGAGVRHHRRWVFRSLDVTVAAGETVAVAGPPGSGRTTVLLALAGRFKLSAGSVALRGPASLAYVPGVTDPEPVLTVGECVRERQALLGRSGPVDLAGLDPARRAWELTPYEKQVLGLVLARIGEPAVIALDGIDIGLDAAEQAALWTHLDTLADAGIAVIAATRTADPSRVTTVITLGGGTTDVHTEPADPAPAADPEPAVDPQPAVDPAPAANPEPAADPEPAGEPAAAGGELPRAGSEAEEVAAIDDEPAGDDHPADDTSAGDGAEKDK